MLYNKHTFRILLTLSILFLLYGDTHLSGLIFSKIYKHRFRAPIKLSLPPKQCVDFAKGEFRVEHNMNKAITDYMTAFTRENIK